MKFLHLRYHWLTNDEPELNAKGGITVAYEVIDGEVRYTMSKCHYRDTFCKRLGRDISQGRFLAGKYKSLPLKEDERPRDLVRADVYRELKSVVGLDLSPQLF